MYGHGRDFRVRNADEMALFNQEKQRDARRRRDRQQLRRDMLQRWWRRIRTARSSN